MSSHPFPVARLAACALASLVLARVAADPIPAERFFSDPVIAHARISPDGRNVAFLAPLNGRMGIVLMDLGTGKVAPLVSTNDEAIESFGWKGNEAIVYWADVGGNEALAVQSINVATRRITRLLESFDRYNYDRQDGYWGHVVDAWPANPQKIIVSGGREPNSRSRDFYAVDIATGQRSSVKGSASDKKLLGQLFDNAGRVRLKYVDVFDHVEVRAALGDESKYTSIMRRPRDSVLMELEHAVILADNRTLLFVDYAQHDRGAVVSWDLATGKQAEELFVPPEGEVTELIFDRARERLLGVRYEADKPHTTWLDPRLATIQAAVDRTFPNTVNRITDWSDDRRRLLVHVHSDREPGINMIFDLTRPQPQLLPLGAAHPDLDAKLLAEMHPVHFAARDGLALQGYLTRPAGATGAGPLVLFPHGGPYGVRDSWGFDPEVQFLASRGYTVLQVNYRGSGGFGRKLLEAGRLEWGRKMQDDLTDAVQWAVKEGVADPKCVAIYGASYGGYAALAGAVFTPDLYRCAINYVGVADLTYLGHRDQNMDPTFNQFYLEKWIHPDLEELKRRSPVNSVARIRVPTLHAYGENDPRVEWRQWKKLKAELDRNHIAYEAFNQGNEGHGFRNADASVGFHARLEEFLKRNLSEGSVKLEDVKVLEMPARQN